MFQADVRVNLNKKLKSNFCLLELESKQISKHAKPGQFIHIHCPADGAFFRRPFCVADAGGGRLSVLYRVVGPGSRFLASKKKGEILNVLGPLGSAYRLPLKNEQIIFIAGGSGIASLNFLAEKIKPLKGTLFYGGRSKQELVFADNFLKLGWELKIATDDGSKGFKGYIGGLFLSEARKFDVSKAVVFMCGPEPMQKSAAPYLINNKIKFYSSLERLMACGVGVCQGCAVKMKTGKYSLCCKEGPVFEGGLVDWEAV